MILRQDRFKLWLYFLLPEKRANVCILTSGQVCNIVIFPNMGKKEQQLVQIRGTMRGNGPLFHESLSSPIGIQTQSQWTRQNNFARTRTHCEQVHHAFIRNWSRKTHFLMNRTFTSQLTFFGVRKSLRYLLEHPLQYQAI